MSKDKITIGSPECDRKRGELRKGESSTHTESRRWGKVLLLLATLSGSGAAQARVDDISSMKALANYAQAGKFVDLHEPSKQLHYLKLALKEAPDSAPLLTDLASAYFDLKQPGTAKNYLEKALRAAPQCREALSRRAFIALLSNNLKPAIADLEKCLAVNKIEPQYNDEGSDAANLLTASKHRTACTEAKQQQLEKHYGGLRRLTEALEMRDQLKLKEALQVASLVTAQYPERASPRFTKAVILLNLGRYKPAANELEILLKREPGNATLLYFHAEAKRLDGAASAAISDYEKILKSGRMLIAKKFTAETGKHRGNHVYFDDWIVTPLDINYLLALTHLELESKGKAYEAIERALALNSQDTDCLLLAASIALEANKGDQAKRFLEQARKTGAASDRLKDLSILTESKSKEQAVAQYKIWMSKLLEEPAKNASTLFIIGRRLEKLKDYELASRCWQSLYDTLPAVPEHKLYLERCRRMAGKTK